MSIVTELMHQQYKASNKHLLGGQSPSKTLLAATCANSHLRGIRIGIHANISVVHKAHPAKKDAFENALVLF